MNPSKIILFLFCCFCAFIAGVEGKGTPRLSFLGTVEDKTYFYDNLTQYTWHTAKNYCNALNMRLATINTPRQESFLKGKYSATGFNGFFWIGVRDARTPNQFVVDHTGLPVADLGQHWTYTPQQTCVRYRAGSGVWYSTSCTYSLVTGVLCETIYFGKSLEA